MVFLGFDKNIARPGFEPGSLGPKPSMLGLYTIGL